MRARKWRRWIPVVVALFVAGCGSSSDQNQVRATFEKFISAVQQHDAQAACSVITDAYWRGTLQDLEARLATQSPLPTGAHGCRGGFAYVFSLEGRTRTEPKVTLSNVVVHGATAAATVGTGHEPIEFAKTGGSWRLSCCAGGQISQAPTAPYRVPSGSMEPTLRIGQIVTSNNAAMRAHPPTIGDIIVFHPPAGADPAEAVCGNAGEGTGHARACDKPTAAVSAQLFIKRVVAGPGDRISIVNGHVIRNGVRESDSYTNACGGGPDCSFPTPIVIPAGEYFVLGDNRGLSDDSRFWGPVKRAWIIGVVER